MKTIQKLESFIHWIRLIISITTYTQMQGKYLHRSNRNQ